MHPLYQDTCSVLSLLERRKGTLRRLCIAPSVRNKKATLALASGTFRYSDALDFCFKEAGIHQRQKDFQHWLLKVLTYELIVGQRKLKGGGAASKLIKDNADALRKAFAATSISAFDGELESTVPRYARINTLKTQVDQVLDSLLKEGYQLKPFDEVVNKKTSKGQDSKIFARDNFLHDVIVFPHDVDLHDHSLVVRSHLRLQDKASCFPAHVLTSCGNHEPIRFALDACSAPGNKTTHLAALMGGEGTILAIELDHRRSAMLRETVRLLGATNVTVMTQDFLSIDPTQPPFCHVEGILMDPSCSGSGIIGRGHESRGSPFSSSHHASSDDSSAHGGAGDAASAAAAAGRSRLDSLARFQTRALCHALSFPRVRRVVYSTCSVHREENEDVVAAAIARTAGRFTLEAALPAWPRRGDGGGGGGGVPPLQDADKCVRVCPGVDHAQGFFVACFVRSCTAAPAPTAHPSAAPQSAPAAAAAASATQAPHAGANGFSAATARRCAAAAGKRQPPARCGTDTGTNITTAAGPPRGEAVGAPAAGRRRAGHGGGGRMRNAAVLCARLRRGAGRRGLASAVVRLAARRR